MTEDIFRRLQERLDQYSMGFPATDSGVEIDILKELFSEDDAELFLHLTPQPDTPEEVARRIDRPLEPVAAHLDDMSEGGFSFACARATVSNTGLSRLSMDCLNSRCPR